MRRLPGPADCELSERDETPEALYELFSGLAEDTNSIFSDGSSEPETANGCPVLHGRNQPPRGIFALESILIGFKCAPSQARP